MYHTTWKSLVIFPKGTGTLSIFLEYDQCHTLKYIFHALLNQYGGQLIAGECFMKWLVPKSGRTILVQSDSYFYALILMGVKHPCLRTDDFG